jgi:hypothetical protein
MIVFADLKHPEERLRFTETASAASKVLTQDLGLGGPGLVVLSVSPKAGKSPLAVMKFYSTYAHTVRVLAELFRKDWVDPWILADKCSFQPDVPTEEELGYEPGVILIEKLSYSESRLNFPVTKVTFYQRAL